MVRHVKKRGLPYAVIDNTLLTRLVRLEVGELLPLLYQQILIPAEVKREAYKAPHKAKRRLRKLVNEMAGFFVRCTEGDEATKNILQADLDAGEAAAIAQAERTGSHVLIDENKGYRRACIMGLNAVRTTTVLLMLKNSGAFPAVKPYFDRLEETGFYLAEGVRNALLAEVGEE
jgi:predicted nucleic acid-binding protein